MAFGALGRVLPAALDEVDDLFAFDLVNDFGLNASVLDQWCANLWLVATQHQHFVELNFVTGVGRNTFHPKHIAEAELCTACRQS